MGEDKPPILFGSAHLSFLAIIIALWRLSVSHSLEVWKSKQTGQDHIIPFVFHLCRPVLSAYYLSMGIDMANLVSCLVNSSWVNPRVILRLSTRFKHLLQNDRL